jgi:hypothetical protein
MRYGFPLRWDKRPKASIPEDEWREVVDHCANGKELGSLFGVSGSAALYWRQSRANVGKVSEAQAEKIASERAAWEASSTLQEMGDLLGYAVGSAKNTAQRICAKHGWGPPSQKEHLSHL